MSQACNTYVKGYCKHRREDGGICGEPTLALWGTAYRCALHPAPKPASLRAAPSLATVGAKIERLVLDIRTERSRPRAVRPPEVVPMLRVVEAEPDEAPGSTLESRHQYELSFWYARRDEAEENILRLRALLGVT